MLHGIQLGAEFKILIYQLNYLNRKKMERKNWKIIPLLLGFTAENFLGNSATHEVNFTSQEVRISLSACNFNKCYFNAFTYNKVCNNLFWFSVMISRLDCNLNLAAGCFPELFPIIC